jgi:hypothetical protein
MRPLGRDEAESRAGRGRPQRCRQRTRASAQRQPSAAAKQSGVGTPHPVRRSYGRGIGSALLLRAPNARITAHGWPRASPGHLTRLDDGPPQLDLTTSRQCWIAARLTSAGVCDFEEIIITIRLGLDLLGEGNSGFSVHRRVPVLSWQRSRTIGTPAWFVGGISSTNTPYSVNSEVCTCELNASSQSCAVWPESAPAGPNRRRCPERDGSDVVGEWGRRWWQPKQLARHAMQNHVSLHAGRHPTGLTVQAHLAIDNEPLRIDRSDENGVGVDQQHNVSIALARSASLWPAAAILLVCCMTHPGSGG